VFCSNEITKNAVLAAIEKPGEIDMNKVNAQQARRILDRIVATKYHLFCGGRFPGLSAGRVQSVALRIICNREDEIKAFRKKNTGRFMPNFPASTGCSGRNS